METGEKKIFALVGFEPTIQVPKQQWDALAQ
jgi:hypothetical protein